MRSVSVWFADTTWEHRKPTYRRDNKLGVTDVMGMTKPRFGTNPRCYVCGAASASFGFGSEPTLWACMKHRAEVDAIWQSRKQGDEPT